MHEKEWNEKMNERFGHWKTDEVKFTHSYQ
jgi:hypothetical protein